MTYEVVMPYHLHMPSYFLGTFTEYPNLLYSLVLMSENAVIFMSYPVNQLFIFFLYCSNLAVISLTKL